MEKTHNDSRKILKRTLVVLFLVFVLIVGVVIGYSTAYFSAMVINRPEPKNTVVTTGVMSIEYTDGPEVSLENAVPGQSITKTFTIKNTGTLSTYYNIYLSDLINDFADKTDLVYTLESNNGGANVLETQVPDASGPIVTNKIIEVGDTHSYTLKIEFKETNDDQNDNIGKNFSSVVRVNDVRN